MGADYRGSMHDGVEKELIVVSTFGPSQEETVRVVIKDTNSRNSFTTELPTSTSVGQLYSKVAEMRGYPRAAFKLTLDDTVVEEEEDGARRLGDVWLERGTSFLKMGLKRSPDYASSEHDHLFDTGGANTHTHTAPASSLTVSISKSAAARPGYAGGATKFCGLSNQGATCYMNSLLQSLYMTPEFREGVYKIPVETNIAKQRESICFQLQCLFASMQLSGESAVETKGLTHSFGWSGSEAFQQHDVQELCRVLFDELESRLKDTREADLINDLFQGHMDSYVRNTAGGAVAFESIKSEAFMDISLSIKEFGQARPIESVEEGLRNFIKPERLDGNNQYKLDADASKGRMEGVMLDADKGLEFQDMPYILTLQLKRFDFDYNTMRRIKIKDRVSFEQELDVGPLLSKTARPKRRNSLAVSSSSRMSWSAEDAKDDDTAGGKADAAFEAMSQDSGANCDMSICRSSADNARVMYDLYSVMVHTGSAFGGHYYAYIKDLGTSVWHKFNDATVTEASWSDVESSFGSSSASTLPAAQPSIYLQSSGATAYMLLYRKRDPELNRSGVPDSAVPRELKEAMAQHEDAQRQEQEQARIKRNSLTLTIFHEAQEISVQVPKKACLNELKQHVRAALPEVGESNDCIRLRKYVLEKDIVSNVIGGDGDVEDDEAASSIEYDTNIQVETRPLSLPPWPPATSSTMCAVKVWVSRDVCPPPGTLSAHTHMRDDCNPTSTPQPPPSERDPMHVGEGDGPSFDVMPRVVYLPREGKVLDLQRYIMNECRVDVEHLVVVRVNRAFNDLAIELLEKSNARLKASDYTPLEGENFFVAKAEGAEKNLYRDSAAFKNTPIHTAVKTAIETVRVTFNTLDASGAAAHAAWLDVQIKEPVARLKERIGQILGLPPDQFRFYRKSGTGASSNKKEILQLEHSAKEADINWGGAPNRLLIEKGSPPATGVHSVKVVWVEMHKTGMFSVTKPVGTLEIQEKMTGLQVKHKLVPLLQQVAARPAAACAASDDVDMQEEVAGAGTGGGASGGELSTNGCAIGSTFGVPHLRVREDKGYGSAEPHKILVDDLPIAGPDGQLQIYKYTTKTLYVERLVGPEPKKDCKSVVVELARWSPAEFAVGPRQHMVVSADETVALLRERLQAITGIDKEAVRLGKSSSWAGTPRLDLEALTWDQVASKMTHAASCDDAACTALGLRDSDLYYYKDVDEVLKTLSDVELAASQAEASEFKQLSKAQSAQAQAPSNKEKGLKIKQRSDLDA